MSSTQIFRAELWDFVPHAFNGYEQSLMEWIATNSDSGQGLLQAIRWTTDTGQGIFLFYASIFLLWYLLSARQEIGLLKSLFCFFYFFLFLGLSDFVCYRLLKIPIGRAKPTIESLGIDGSDRLSFPSSHAFNTAFAFVIFYLSIKKIKKSPQPWVFFIGLAIVIMVAASRVFLLEHFPSDVFFGVILGALFSWAIFPFFWGLLQGISRRSTKLLNVSKK